MDHGVVHLEFQRDRSAAEDPFVGTVQIEVTLIYRECLIGFYDDNPQWSQPGVEGAVVFDSAVASGLCDPESGVIDCSVAEITQVLGMVRQLTVVYDVQQPVEDNPSEAATDQLAAITLRANGV